MKLKEYKGKRLTTDEVAFVRTEIYRLTKELEYFDYETGDDHLLFKWGTLKSWRLSSKKGKDLLKEYFELGSSTSAIMQHDSARQKELIYQMIDECDGTLQSDWGGEYFTKEQANKSIRNNKNWLTSS
jgi:hypothetical protein